MDIFSQIVLLVVGFVLLIKGADWLIEGSSSVASHFKVSKQLIGLTIVAIGTGAPELAVSISSLASGNTDLLIGNVMGSNIINILLLIGVAATIKPFHIRKTTIAKELPLLLLISTALVILFLDTSITGASTNEISRSDALICILLFAIFIYYIVRTTRKNRKANKEVAKPKFKLGSSFILVIIGLIGVVAGSQLVVDSASFIASAIGISDRVIALSVVALGTSLPELVTTITAAKRGEHDLIIGNVVGSNIFNICIVLGLPVILFGTISPESFEVVDIAMLIGSAIILWLVTATQNKITRKEGILMLVIFAIYYGYLIYGAIV
ncbi:calcium/sodium antiporter [Candidatus Saccharibacteria bacterium]|nr:calcium/sodium antiporter [Candidatus Saccharibacteria bacterium]